MHRDHQAHTRKRSLSTALIALVTASTAIAAAGSATAQSFTPNAYIGGAYGVTNAPTDHQTRPHFGIGLGYDITPAIDAQLGWERTTGIGRNFAFGGTDPERSNGKLNYDLVSLALTYRFR